MDEQTSAVVEQKCWGQCHHLFVSPHAAVSLLKLKAKTRSSWHLHRDRVNLFHVLCGQIVVEWSVSSQSSSTSSVSLARVRLGTGYTYTVPTGVNHRFRVVEDGEVIEIYWPDRFGVSVRLDDIERFDVGGEDLEWEELIEYS